MLARSVVLLALAMAVCSTSVHADEDKQAAGKLSAWVVGRWETARPARDMRLWLDFRVNGDFRMGGVDHWSDARFQVSGQTLVMSVPSKKDRGTDEQRTVPFTLDAGSQVLQLQGPGERLRWTRVGPAPEIPGVVGVWSRSRGQEKGYMRFTAGGSVHARVPIEAEKGRYEVAGSQVKVSTQTTHGDTVDLALRRDGAELVLGEGRAATHFRRLDNPWYPVPGETRPPHPVGSWMLVKEGRLEGWTFVFQADGRASIGVAHQEGFSGNTATWRWVEDVIEVTEAAPPRSEPDPDAGRAGSAEAMRLLVRPIGSDAVDLWWLDDEVAGRAIREGGSGAAQTPAQRYERTTCPERLQRAWSGTTAKGSWELTLGNHHRLESRTTGKDGEAQSVRHGEWHVWRDRLWLTTWPNHGFAEFGFESTNTGELILTPERGAKVTLRARPREQPR